MYTVTRKCTSRVLPWSACLIAVIPALCKADPITFRFTGTITSVTDPEHILNGQIAINDAFTGAITFESTASDLRPSDPSYGQYEFPDGSLMVRVGSITIEGTPCVDVSNSSFSDRISIGAALPITAGDLKLVEFAPVSLYDRTGSVFSTDSLPTIPPALADFASARFWMQSRPLGGGQIVTVEGRVDTLTPEPTSMMLLCACFAPFFRRVRPRSFAA